MGDLEDLFPGLEAKSDEELLAIIQQSRADRRVSKKDKYETKASRKKKVDTAEDILKKLSGGDLAKVLAALGKS